MSIRNVHLLRIALVSLVSVMMLLPPVINTAHDST